MFSKTMKIKVTQVYTILCLGLAIEKSTFVFAKVC